MSGQVIAMSNVKRGADMPAVDEVFTGDDPAYLDEPAMEAPPADRPNLKPAPRWRRAVDVMGDSSPAPIVEGCLFSNCITVLVGESAAGKTHVAIAMGAALDAPLGFHGRRVRHGSVVYAGFEGTVGVRLKAYREVAGFWLKHIFVVDCGDPLSPMIDRDRLEVPGRGELGLARALDEITAAIEAEQGPPIVLVIVDTIRASLAGPEESSENASAYLRAVRRLMTHTPGAAWMLLHHSGWMDGEAKRRRERGSSAFRGNVDATLYLEAGEYDRQSRTKPLTLTALKVRDGETPPPLHMILRQVEVPGLFDPWGEPVTSCIVEADRQTREDREAEAQRVAETRQHDLDLRLLQTIAKRPQLATSKDGIRSALRVKADQARDTLDRAIERDWVNLPTGQRKPYTLTAAGEALLSAAGTSRTESDRVGPNSGRSE
jgi:hypothetical protein